MSFQISNWPYDVPVKASSEPTWRTACTAPLTTMVAMATAAIEEKRSTPLRSISTKLINRSRRPPSQTAMEETCSIVANTPR